MIVESIIGNDGDDNAMDDDIASLRDIIKSSRDFLGQICKLREFLAWFEVVNDDDGQVILRSMKIISLLYGP